ELEAQAARQGYCRVFLTTGFRQPEAVGLYLSHGYTALYDLHADPETIAHLPFEKRLLPDPAARAVAAVAAREVHA
ncbi:MAG: GNAT family N-acetyltransferase, partial [Stenotrophomonas sp.]